jgi:glycine/D-amino acid oxidase-like deaminating enzyme
MAAEAETSAEDEERSRELPGEPASFWIESMPGDGFAPLADGITVDVAVVGAGISGITAATLLKQAGKTVAVLESKEIVRGTTGYTTAKVTAGHRLVYQDLRKIFGEEGVRLYADSQRAALARVADLVAERGLECDFRRAPHYVYAESDDDLVKIESEVDAEQELGLAASYVDDIPLPFQVAGALRLDEQAQFHPRKYLLPLAQAIPGDGSHLFERTRVLDVDEGSLASCTQTGGASRRAR